MVHFLDGRPSVVVRAQDERSAFDTFSAMCRVAQVKAVSMAGLLKAFVDESKDVQHDGGGGDNEDEEIEGEEIRIGGPAPKKKLAIAASRTASAPVPARAPAAAAAAAAADDGDDEEDPLIGGAARGQLRRRVAQPQAKPRAVPPPPRVSSPSPLLMDPDTRALSKAGVDVITKLKSLAEDALQSRVQKQREAAATAIVNGLEPLRGVDWNQSASYKQECQELRAACRQLLKPPVTKKSGNDDDAGGGGGEDDEDAGHAF